MLSAHLTHVLLKLAWLFLFTGCSCSWVAYAGSLQVDCRACLFVARSHGSFLGGAIQQRLDRSYCMSCAACMHSLVSTG